MKDNYEVVKKIDEYEDLVVQKQDVDEVSVIAVILAIFLPPLGVALKCGIGFSFVVNILLTLLGFFPGVIHALFVILRK